MRSDPGTVVLCYHRVTERAGDPFRLCVSLDNFERQLRQIRRRTEIVPLEEATRPARRRKVVLTFDDGYADNLTGALPVVSDLGVPITVYVTSGVVGSPLGFWWDRLARLVAEAPDAIRGDGLPFALPRWRDRAELLQRLHRGLRELEPGEIHGILDGLASRARLPAGPVADARVLSHAELAELAAWRGVTIGAHTVDHVLLRGRPKGEQFATMRASKEALESELGRPVSAFAYPFGGAGDIDEASVRAAEEAGFASAVTTLPGSVRPGDDPFRLRRRMVMDWSGPRFAAQLVRWGIW